MDNVKGSTDTTPSTMSATETKPNTNKNRTDYQFSKPRVVKRRRSFGPPRFNSTQGYIAVKHR